MTRRVRGSQPHQRKRDEDALHHHQPHGRPRRAGWSRPASQGARANAGEDDGHQQQNTARNPPSRIDTWRNHRISMPIAAKPDSASATLVRARRSLSAHG